jgi:PadR family transcriptional regulator PadR
MYGSSMYIAKDLVAASAAPMVLGILADADSYGYAILARVRELSGGHIEWTDGLLYPLLHRLEEQGLVEATWGAAENGRKRKYYRITPQGRDSLAEHQLQWRTVSDALRETWGNVKEAAAWAARPAGGMAT